jgi:hypothetical protein
MMLPLAAPHLSFPHPPEQSACNHQILIAAREGIALLSELD